MSQPRRVRNLTTRGARPRPSVGQLRRTEPMVHPTWSTVFKHSIKNGKFGALILVIAGLWAIGFVLRSPSFLVDEPVIDGNRSVAAATIVQLADVHGRSIWDIQPADVAARVAQNSYVFTATIDLRLPNIVEIHVQEREAVIVWNAAGTNYEVTADGVVLGPSAPITGTILVIHDTRPTPLAVDSRVDIDALNLAQTLNLRMPAEVGWSPTRYEWDPYYGLSIFNATQQVAFGRMDDQRVSLDRKLSTLKSVTESGDAWTFLDVRPEKPYYRPVITPTPLTQDTP